MSIFVRDPISKKTRFEVFKRDSFTCQYCGAQAPDVILHVDHIKPVATGGDSDITNLITSCFDCNSGKGPRELSDDTVIAKQRVQLEELNERRNQLEMMLEWRQGLAVLHLEEALIVKQAVEKHSKVFALNDHGKRTVEKWVRKYPVSELLEAIQISFDQYLVWDEDRPTEESWNKAFEYVPKVLNGRRRQADKPYLKDLFYVRGILRNRLSYVNEYKCMGLLERAYLAGATIESIREHAKSARSWTAWREAIEEFLEENEKPDAQ